MSIHRLPSSLVCLIALPAASFSSPSPALPSSKTLSNFVATQTNTLVSSRRFCLCLLIATTMASSCTAPSPLLGSSALWASPLPGASSSNSQKSSLRFTQQLTWPSQISGRRAFVTAEYRRGGGGDFVAGFFLGGVVFGALGYVLAPQDELIEKRITKSLERAQTEKEDELSSKMEDDESLETTRRNLNERIAQLSAQIDDVSAQVKNDGFANINSTVELESA